jgi:hypothetical protein
MQTKITRRRHLKLTAGATAACWTSARAQQTSPRKIAPGPFQPTWESLVANYKTPEWFRDAKFGMWAHWTAQCVPEQGDWYARRIPACAGFGTAHLQARLEVVRAQGSLYRQEADGVCLPGVECNRASIEGNGRAHGFGNGTEQRFLGEVRNDGVVDIEEAAFQLLALP